MTMSYRQGRTRAGLLILSEKWKFLYYQAIGILHSVVYIKFNPRSKPLVGKRVFHGSTPIVCKNSLAFSTWYFLASLPECGRAVTVRVSRSATSSLPNTVNAYSSVGCVHRAPHLLCCRALEVQGVRLRTRTPRICSTL